jgi:hypothetical protein
LTVLRGIPFFDSSSSNSLFWKFFREFLFLQFYEELSFLAGHLFSISPWKNSEGSRKFPERNLFQKIPISFQKTHQSVRKSIRNLTNPKPFFTLISRYGFKTDAPNSANKSG